MFAPVKHIAAKALASAVVVVGVFAPMAATSASAQEMEPVTAHLGLTVKVDGVSSEELYNFVTDLHNDALWFPNVAETVQTAWPTRPHSKAGTEYDQISFFNGIELHTHAVVTGDATGHYFHLVGNGPVATYDSQYVFRPANDGSGVFQYTTSFTAPGITEEVLDFLLTQAMQNILNHFNTTGEIEFHFLVVND